MQSIIEDIKNNKFKAMYLLYGEEGYLRKQYRDKLKDALKNQDDTMNYHYFEGKDISSGEVIDLAETMPFFADRRVIVIENSGLCKHGGEQMADYLAQVAETVVFILVETEVDKRSKLFKVLRDHGKAVEFPLQEEATLKRWIKGLLGKEEKKITDQALQNFLEKTGSDMENIKTELEKLICFTLDKEVISEQDVNTICVARISNRIFDMINAMADKRQKKALDLYYDLLELREPPMRILFLIVRQFNLLLQVKELKQKKCDNRKISEKIGLPSFVVSKYMEQSDKFSATALRGALEACVETEEAVKTGRMMDKMSVELLIVAYSS